MVEASGVPNSSMMGGCGRLARDAKGQIIQCKNEGTQTIVAALTAEGKGGEGIQPATDAYGRVDWNKKPSKKGFSVLDWISYGWYLLLGKGPDVAVAARESNQRGGQQGGPENGGGDDGSVQVPTSGQHDYQT